MSQWDTLAVPSSAIRSFHCPMDFHQGYGGGKEDGCSARDHHAHVHWRLGSNESEIHSSQSSETVCSHSEWVLKLCSRLGLRVNFLKLDLVPSQDFTFIGYLFVTQSHQVFPPLKRTHTLVQLLDCFLTSRSYTAFLWHRLLRLLASTKKLVPLGQLSYEKPSEMPSDPVGLHQPVPSSSVVVCSRSPSGGSSHSPSSVGDPDLQGQLDNRLGGSLSGTGCFRPVVPAGTSPAHQQPRVVYKALLHWESLVSNKVVLVVTDNTTVLSYINRQGGTRSHLLARTATEMLVYFYKRGVEIQAKHIAGKL